MSSFMYFPGNSDHTKGDKKAGQKNFFVSRKEHGGSPPIRLLIIDDNRYFLESLTFILHLKKDMQVVGNNFQARGTLDLVRDLEPDIVIMDVMLPDMDGVTLLEKIKEQYPDLPVILFSMCGDLKRKALRRGAYAYLVKGEESIDALYQAILEGVGRKE